MTSQTAARSYAATVAPFTMFGARTGVAGGWSHIEKQVAAIERATAEDPGLAFDLAKTIVESACKTILSDLRVAYGSDDDLPKLFKSVTNSLPMLPASASGEAEARRSLVQTIRGLHTALQGVCELRNAYGFASQSSEAERPAMETVQALLAAQAADAIVGFLFRVHADRRLVAAALPEFGDHPEFNAFIDDTNEMVQIFDLEYRPSEVLYGIDRQAYLDLLSGFVGEQPEQESETADGTAGVAS